MNNILKIGVFVALMLGIYSCNSKEEVKTEDTQDFIEETDGFTDMSIYNLPSVWTNQDGEDIELHELKDNVLVMVMIFTSCQAACPRLVADMRHIRKQTADFPNKEKVKYVLVSIDPKTDTPERLKEFAIENQMDDDQWIFLRSDEENTREFAQVLAVSYKRISPVDFSHSNIISIFNPKGEMVYQAEGLGIDYEPTVNKIKSELEAM